MSEFDLLTKALGDGQWLALAAVSATVIIRVYRNPGVQGILPESMQWGNLPKWVRLTIVFLASFTVTWATSIVTGGTSEGALAAAIPVALGAVATHKATKAIGHNHTARQIKKKGPAYEPGSLRTSLDIVLPMGRKQMDEAKRNA